MRPVLLKGVGECEGLGVVWQGTGILERGGGQGTGRGPKGVSEGDCIVLGDCTMRPVHCTAVIRTTCLAATRHTRYCIPSFASGCSDLPT